MADAMLASNAVERACGAGQGLAHGNIDDLAVCVDKQVAVVGGKAFKGNFSITQSSGLGAKLEPVDHVFLFHGASSKNKQLVARFFKRLFQRKAHRLGLELCIARNCAIEDVFYAAARSSKNNQQYHCQNRQPKHEHAVDEAAIHEE